jgi:large subunit ribosomal protein L24
MLNVKKDDNVVILSGKYKGKQGKILGVLHKQRKVIVQKINMITKHIKSVKDNSNSNGKICIVEAPLYASKVMIICPHCKKAFRIKYNNNNISKENINKIRVCRICGLKI